MTAKDIHPPENYITSALQTITFVKGTSLYRIFNSVWGRSGAFYFAKDTESDKTISGRFGDLNMNVAVCYLGDSFHTAIVETVMHDDATNEVKREADLNILSSVKIQFSRDLKLVQFYGDGLVNNKADASLTTSYHMQSRLWSTQIILNENNYDGIIWRSKINDDLKCIALFDTAQDAMELNGQVFHDSLMEKGVRDEVATILEIYAIDII